MRRYAVILAAALAWPISIDTAEARLDILVDKATQRMLVIQNGYIRHMWPVSTGRDELATPSGVYAPQRMERNWFSTAYYNSPMPYSIFFHNGYAIHGSYAINQLGGPASHGCVRLHPHHAALLFELVQQEGPDKTTIEVTDAARPDEPPLPGAEIAPGQVQYRPEPRMVRYREFGDMPESPLARRANRSIAARAAVPSKPAPVGGRRAQPDVVAEGSSRDAPREQVREQAPQVREQAPPTPAVYGFKVLPASCWSGGASRWRWWASSQGGSCK